jgi:transposase IS116/IS110/IS902 family protein
VFLRRAKILEAGIVEHFSKGNDLRYLDSIPGVSPLLAATILAELRPLNRFTRVEQVIAYAGLDPSVKQSGIGGTLYPRPENSSHGIHFIEAKRGVQPGLCCGNLYPRAATAITRHLTLHNWSSGSGLFHSVQI